MLDFWGSSLLYIFFLKKKRPTWPALQLSPSPQAKLAAPTAFAYAFDRLKQLVTSRHRVTQDREDRGGNSQSVIN